MGTFIVDSTHPRTVSGGVTDTNDVVMSGGELQVLSGGKIIGTSVRTGGLVIVFSGGSGLNTTLSGGSGDFSTREQVDGVESGAIINGGFQIVDGGGIAWGTMISGGGTQYIGGNGSGGTALNTTVSSGGVQILYGGSASGTTVEDWGVQTISAGALASTTIVSSGGVQNDFSSLPTVGTIVSGGGVENMLDGNTVGTILSGGRQNVSAFSVASGTIITSGGDEYVYAGGYASGSLIDASGFQILSGGTAFYTVINSFGYEFVSSGGATTSTTVNTSGTEAVSAGGSADWTVISGGYEYVGTSGAAYGTTIAGGKLELANGAIALAGYPIIFVGTGGTLQIDGTTSGSMPRSVISGFSPGNTIDLAGVSFAHGGSVQLKTGKILELYANGNTYDLQLDPSQSFAGESFKLSSDGSGGVDINVRAGLSINITYDASVDGVSADIGGSDGFKAGMAAAVAELEGTFTNAVTLNFDVGWGEENGNIIPTTAPQAGLSETAIAPAYSYNQVKAALNANKQSLVQIIADSTLPNSFPGTFDIGTADAKAIGLFPANQENTGAYDGWVGFNSDKYFAFNPADGVPQGYLDFVDVAEHEMSHAMGRNAYGGITTPHYSNAFSALDLFRYANQAGQQYFSYDGGHTAMDFSSLPGSIADWDNTRAGADAFDDVTQPGRVNPLTAVDQDVMQVIGWDTSVAGDVVPSGQIAFNKLVTAGNYLDVLSGGIANLTTIANGGTEDVFGTDSGATVNDGGLQIVYAGGVAEDAVLEDPGTQIVEMGGTTVAPLISGGIEELAAGAVVSGAITFAGPGGELRIDATSGGMPAVVISGLRPGDTIDLTSIGFDISGSIILKGGNVLELVENGQTYDLDLDPSQNFAGWGVKLSSDGASGTDIRLGGQRDDFNFDRTSDILFRNDSNGDTWAELISAGTFATWSQIGGSNTSFATAGIGDFYGTGTDDVLFRNASTGDTWIETISNAGFAAWNQIGGSDTHYTVAGVADFYGNGNDDILFRNTTSGDTWFEAISNGSFAGWHQIGGSDTRYSMAGVGDFYGNGTDDILFRNNTTGDTWLEQVSNGLFDGWHQIGGSDTHYTVVGVGDFYGNATDDILFRNNSTGDTWIEQISNGAFKSWQQVGGSDTTYAVVGVGDYFANGTQDVLFRNDSTGDTWVEALSNGQFNGWHQVGGSSTSYAVKT